MGNYFNQPANPNQGLLQFLRQLHLPEIQKVAKYVQQNYPATNVLSLGEFFDVYHAILKQHCGEMFETIENNHSTDGLTDIYESQAVLIIFSDTDFATKVKYISQVFDLDKSQKLEKIELIMIFQTAIRSLCKIVNMKPPGFTDIEYYVEAIFTEMDKNLDRTISYEELYSWLDNNYQLQDFLLKYAQTQTFQNAKRRTQDIFNSKNLFKHNQDEWIQDYIQNAEESYSQLIQRKKLVSDRVKDEINYAWSAFKATDINNDGTISVRELPYLIYGFEGIIIKDVRKRFGQLDKDKSGSISLKEWFNYLQLDQGVEICKSIVKRYFLKRDTNNVGSLNNQQSCQVLRDTLSNDGFELYFKGFESYINEHSTLDKMSIQQLQDFVEGPMKRIIQDKQELMEKEKERKQAQNEKII
ncbi:unnamed protein product [Paramecium sonneborni]|uniref:EF-hand domain-containing protein n=1 Tax=Paramecium sonneborni TaxID=65129 RepID=A0A8S1K2C2_9CILI|nr:unnamed protein product [Paramecium sonneborni]